MAAPIPRPTSEFRTPVSFYIPVAVRERLAQVAFKERAPLSHIVTRALAAYFDAHHPESQGEREEQP